MFDSEIQSEREITYSLDTMPGRGVLRSNKTNANELVGIFLKLFPAMQYNANSKVIIIEEICELQVK